jgi:hypothetical protein
MSFATSNNTFLNPLFNPNFTRRRGMLKALRALAATSA